MRWHRLAVLLAVAGLASCEKQGETWYLKGFAPTGDDSIKRALSEDPDLRAKAIIDWSAHDWGRKGAYVEFYSSALQRDESAVVRSAAARALGRCGDPKHAPLLAAALRDHDTAVRWDAAMALDQVLGDSAVEPLRQSASSDPSVNVRVAALGALRHYRSKAVLDTLLRCLGEQPFGISYQAHQSLVTLTGQDAGYDADKWTALLTKPPPPAATTRPWWDWMNVSQPPTTAPSTRPAASTQPASSGANR